MYKEKIILDVPYEKFNCKKDDKKAVLTCFIEKSGENMKPTETDKAPAMIVCPGGAYFFLYDGEGEIVADEYRKAGLKTFLLEYSVTPNIFPSSLMELATAIKYVRENADKYGVNPDEIYICGFSAGGHLCGSMATLYNKEFLTEALSTTKDMIKPAGAVLSYPVITAGEYTHYDSCVNLFGTKDYKESEYYKYASLENQVDEETSPIFIWTTVTDTAVPMENSLLMVQALRKANVDFEFHLFPVGDHGLSIATEKLLQNEEDRSLYNYINQWFGMSVNWIKNRNL